jgi:23S rRNA pseudouridine1911/1915/1917 synthase
VKPRQKLWVVRDGDGKTVAEILKRAGEDVKAIEEGRVFVGKQRVARADTAVEIGVEVRIGPRLEQGEPVKILARTEGLVAVEKRAGMPTVPDHVGTAHSLVALVAQELKKQVSDLRVTSRLDREVSGVVIFALDEASEKKLIEARNAGEYQRRYLALGWAEHPLADEGVWGGAIGAGHDARHRAVDGPDAKPSATKFKVIARTGQATLLSVEPLTGRTHQIRVHASHAGAPLIGDRDYGGPTRLTLEGGRVMATSRIELHALRVSVAGLSAEAPVPAEMEEIWKSLGGDASAWEKARA